MMTRAERVLKRLGIEARRGGREWLARCPEPSHDDKNPSWRIRDDEGTERDCWHKCQSCGFGGGIVLLVSTVLGCPGYEARAWLAGDDDIAVAKPVAEAVELKIGHRRKTMRVPEGVIFDPLAEWVTPPRRYLERRGIPAWQVDRWGIGYAVDGKLGGRIVIPYRDGGRRVRGYTARTFVGDAKRYKEPEPYEGATRGAMFGEEHWPIVSRETLHVTEGALNALAVERALGEGVNVGAIAGSHLLPAHARKLATFARVIVLTDSDAAGDRVAGEIAGSIARHSVVVRVRLPEGKDAAELPSTELARWVEREAT